MVQFYSTDGSHTNIEAFSSTEIENAIELKNIAQKELDQAKKDAYDSLKIKEEKNAALLNIINQLEKTVKELDALVIQSEENKKKAIEESAKAQSASNLAKLALENLEQSLEKSTEEYQEVKSNMRKL